MAKAPPMSRSPLARIVIPPKAFYLLATVVGIGPALREFRCHPVQSDVTTDVCERPQFAGTIGWDHVRSMR